MSCETLHGVHADLNAAAAGNAVKQDRQLGLARHCTEMLKQSFLVGLL